MPIGDHRERVLYYPHDDASMNFTKDRLREIISTWSRADVDGINEAIEVHECWRLIKQHPEKFEEDEITALADKAEALHGVACSAVGSLFKESSVDRIYEHVEMQYASDTFWGFVSSLRLYEKIAGSDLAILLERYPERIGDVLGHPPLVERFDEELASAMRAAPEISAEIIIRLAEDLPGYHAECNLRRALDSSSIDRIMLDYLSSPMSNLNHVRILTQWPSARRNIYSPSPDVMVRAQERSEELEHELLSGPHVAIEYGSRVIFSPNQLDRRKVTKEGTSLTISYSEKLLGEHLDPLSVMLAFKDTFKWIDPVSTQMAFLKDRREMSVLEHVFCRSPLGAYPENHSFRMEASHLIPELDGYRRLLRDRGIRLEDVIEWFYNGFIKSQFGIRGFSISMPDEKSSYFEKCKSVGPEIERVLKAFKLYAKRCEIDDRYFPHVRIKDFTDIPSLMEQKYLVEGDRFEQLGQLLFSDQSILHFSGRQGGPRNFFSTIYQDKISKSTIPASIREYIDLLESNGLIEEAEDDSVRPTNRASVLSMIWRFGAIGIFAFSSEVKRISYSLVADRLLVYSNNLLAPNEADYFSYMYNDSKFSNAVALRNKYDHASAGVDDPNSSEVKRDYLNLLVLLICATLKILEELVLDEASKDDRTPPRPKTERGSSVL